MGAQANHLVGGRLALRVASGAEGEVRLKLFRGDEMIVVEATSVGQLAFTRADMLRKTFCVGRQ